MMMMMNQRQDTITTVLVISYHTLYIETNEQKHALRDMSTPHLGSSDVAISFQPPSLPGVPDCSAPFVPKAQGISTFPSRSNALFEGALAA